MKMKDNPVSAPPLTGKLREQSLQQIDHRSLFDNMLNGVAWCRIIYENDVACDFQYLDVNPAFISITGLKDPVGKMASELIPGIREEHPKLFEIYERIVSNGQPEQFDFFVKDLGIWLSIFVYSSERGYFTVIFEDITQRKELETTLKINKKRFRQIAEYFDDAVWEIDNSGLFTFCSASIVKITGYTPEELKGRMHFFDLLDPPEGEKMKSWLSSMFQRKEAYNNLVVCCLHRENRKIYIEIKGLPLIDKNGILLGYHGTVLDVKESEHAYELFRASELKFSTIFMNVPALLSISDPATGKLFEVNEIFLETSGFTREEIIGKTSTEIGWVKPIIRENLSEIIASNGRIPEMELHLNKKNGDEVIVKYLANIIRIEERDYLLSMARDITERRMAEVALKRNEQLLRQSQMSPHFIFNAMNSIQSYILKNDIDNALHYLSLISKLIRSTLDYTYRPCITLADELTYLVSFIDLEKMRFELTFDMNMVIDPEIEIETTMIPPMIIQPLVENAIRQGLLEQEGTGELLLEIAKESEQVYRFAVQYTDIYHNSLDGPGKPGKDHNLKNTQKAMEIVQERIRLCNEITNSGLYHMSFHNLTDAEGMPSGMRVEVRIPLVID